MTYYPCVVPGLVDRAQALAHCKVDSVQNLPLPGWAKETSCVPSDESGPKCNGQDNNCDSSVDDDKAKCATSPNNPRCHPCDYKCKNANGVVSDPVTVANGASYLRDADIIVRTARGEVGLFHTFTSADDSWSLERSQNDWRDDGKETVALPMEGVPKPFGSSPRQSGSLNWWHNFYSFVVEANGLFVRDTDGHMLAFGGMPGHPCTREISQAPFYQIEYALFDTCTSNTFMSTECTESTGICYARNRDGTGYNDRGLFFDSVSPDKLVADYSSGHKYTLWKKDGTRYLYDQVWKGEHPSYFYFLSSIRNPQNELLANIVYGLPDATECALANPRAGGPRTACPDSRFPALDAAPTQCTAPFIDRVELANGSFLKFHYDEHSRGSLTECVLDSVELKSGTTTISTVSYQYGVDGSQIGEVSAIGISAAGAPMKTIKIDYIKSSGAYSNIHFYEEVAAQSRLLASHSFANGIVSDILTQTEHISVTGASGKTHIDVAASDGGITKTYSTIQLPGEFDFIVDAVTTSCGFETSCAGGVTTAARVAGAAGLGAVDYEVDTELHRKDYSYASSPYPDFPELYELRGVSQDYTDASGSHQLETAYSYQYISSQPPGEVKDYKIQRPETVVRPSVYPGRSAVETFAYKNSDQRRPNRIQSHIVKGWSPPAIGEPANERFVATFHFYGTDGAVAASGNCAGGVDVVEVHGPCYVNGPTATDCSGSYPITQTVYYPSAAAGHKKAQVWKTIRLTGGCSWDAQQEQYACADGRTAICATDALVHTFDDYDAAGNVTAETDLLLRSTGQQAGAHQITKTYVPGTDLLKTRHEVSDDSEDVDTVYDYEGGKLKSIHHPSGTYEVFCYRKLVGTPGEYAADTCSRTGTDVLTDRVSWKALASDAQGLNWSEKIVYTYSADGTLLGEYTFTSCGYDPQTQSVDCHPELPAQHKLRTKKTYASDAQRRQIRATTGEGAAAFTGERSFGHADELRALGLPYNDPPAHCGWDSVAKAFDSSCKTLAYDEVHALTSVTEYLDDKTQSKTCFEHDTNLNITKVEYGCDGEVSCADCLASSASAQYSYDDFGNLIEASLPNTRGPSEGKGRWRFTHDASGKVIVRMSDGLLDEMAGEGPAFPPRIQIYYDLVGRELGSIAEYAYHIYSGVSAGRVALWLFSYDAESTNCEHPSNGIGRLSTRTDSFGATTYCYDFAGRVVAERGQRAAEVCGGCDEDLPVTQYTYHPDGRLKSVRYPHHRSVFYDYYGDFGRSDRVSRVRTSKWTSAGQDPSASTMTVVRNVEWEPFGGLSRYSIPDNRSTPVLGDVWIERLAGLPESALSGGACNSYQRDAASDYSGRTRSLLVSSSAAGSGDLFRKTLRWRADQIAESETCARGMTSPVVEGYAYDRALRLTDYSSPGGTRTYAFEGASGRRGLRTSESTTDPSAPSPISYTYGQGSEPDRLSAVQGPGTGWRAETLTSAYDRDGRVMEQQFSEYLSPGPSSFPSRGIRYYHYNQPENQYRSGMPPLGAIDDVYGVTYRDDGPLLAGGGIYSYYYDANGRRWQKTYPTDETDEYFYDTGHQMLEDRGNDVVAWAAEYRTLDEYIWLAGRPIALVLAKLDKDTRYHQLDMAGSCGRNKESPNFGDGSRNCGLYYIVSDEGGRPAATIDWKLQLAGVALENAPFGGVNTRPLAGDSSHPYTGNETRIDPPLATANIGVESVGLEKEVRFRFAMIDGDCGGYDGLQFANSQMLPLFTAGTGLYGTLSMNHRWGSVPSRWLGGVDDGIAKVLFTTNDTNYIEVCDSFSCTCTPNPPGQSGSYTGVSLDSFEYRVYETGSTFAWPSLALPGHYVDAETGNYENWHRYYDPRTGRYLQQEPLMRDPESRLEKDAWRASARLRLCRKQPAGLRGLGRPQADEESRRHQHALPRDRDGDGFLVQLQYLGGGTERELGRPDLHRGCHPVCYGKAPDPSAQLTGASCV
ncbi:MAG: hypothetical protein QM765_50080 [Myxococcales bacterium]